MMNENALGKRFRFRHPIFGQSWSMLIYPQVAFFLQTLLGALRHTPKRTAEAPRTASNSLERHSHGGSPLGPARWMVYSMEDPNIKWRTGGTPISGNLHVGGQSPISWTQNPWQVLSSMAVELNPDQEPVDGLSDFKHLGVEVWYCGSTGWWQGDNDACTCISFSLVCIYYDDLWCILMYIIHTTLRIDRYTSNDAWKKHTE